VKVAAAVTGSGAAAVLAVLAVAAVAGTGVVRFEVLPPRGVLLTGYPFERLPLLLPLEEVAPAAVAAVGAVVVVVVATAVATAVGKREVDGWWNTMLPLLLLFIPRCHCSIALASVCRGRNRDSSTTAEEDESLSPGVVTSPPPP